MQADGAACSFGGFSLDPDLLPIESTNESRALPIAYAQHCVCLDGKLDKSSCDFMLGETECFP